MRRPKLPYYPLKESAEKILITFNMICRKSCRTWLVLLERKQICSRLKRNWLSFGKEQTTFLYLAFGNLILAGIPLLIFRICLWYLKPLRWRLLSAKRAGARISGKTILKRAKKTVNSI